MGKVAGFPVSQFYRKTQTSKVVDVMNYLLETLVAVGFVLVCIELRDIRSKLNHISIQLHCRLPPNMGKDDE